MPSGLYRRVVGTAEGTDLVAGLSHDEKIPLYQECNATLKLRATAQFRRTLAPLVTKVVPAWSAYQQARTAMDAAYEALLATSDSTWRAQITKLPGLHADAQAAAAAWDAAEAELLTSDHAFRLEAGYRYDDWMAPELADLIAAYGVDAKPWKLNHLKDHQADPYARDFLAPAAKDTAEVIEQQRVLCAKSPTSRASLAPGDLARDAHRSGGTGRHSY